MIEKFTPEELAQIRKELREKDHVSRKEFLLKEQLQRALRALHYDQVKMDNCSFVSAEIKNALTLLVDHALNNYMKDEAKSRNAGKTLYKRNTLIPGNMEKKYLEAYTKIVDVLEEISEPWEDAPDH